MKKKIFIILGIVSFVFVISIISFLILKKDTKEMFIETKPVVSTLADGTSYIFGADVDQSFKVKADDGFTYKIVDADNNEIKTTVTEKDNYLIINAPAEKYKQGKVYTLTITNGKFEDKDLKEANCVSFSIKREAKQVSKFNSNVKIVSAKENIVSENEDKITLKSDEKYKNGTIILVSDDYSQKAYKIEKYENGIYILSKPEITEVYDELDYYGSYSLDLSNFEGNKEIEDYLVSKAKSSLVDSLIIPVDAAGKTNIETKWDEKKEELIIKIDLENGAGEKLFNKPFLKYHSLNFEFEYRLKAVANVDVNVFEGIYDLNVSFTIKEVPKVGVTYNNGKVKELQEAFDKYASSENVYDAFKIDYDKLKKDDKKLNQKLGTIPIETPIAGLNFEVGVALIMEFDLKADFSAKLTSTQNIVVGVNTSGIYGSFKTSSDVEASILGEAKMRLGLEGLAGFDLVGIAKLNATLEGGIYGKASIELKNNAESLKSNFNVVVVGEAGTFVTVKANAELLDFKFSHVITEKEVKLADINDLFAAVKGEDKPVIKEETSQKEEIKPKPEATQKPQTNNSSNNNTQKNINLVGNWKHESSNTYYTFNSDYSGILYVNATGETIKYTFVWGFQDGRLSIRYHDPGMGSVNNNITIYNDNRIDIQPSKGLIYSRYYGEIVVNRVIERDIRLKVNYINVPSGLEVRESNATEETVHVRTSNESLLNNVYSVSYDLSHCTIESCVVTPIYNVPSEFKLSATTISKSVSLINKE